LAARSPSGITFTLIAEPDPAPQVLKTQLAAKQEGYADVVYLDAKTDTYLEEVSSCNIFSVQGKHIRTPPIEVRRTIETSAKSAKVVTSVTS